MKERKKNIQFIENIKYIQEVQIMEYGLYVGYEKELEYDYIPEHEAEQ